MNSDGRKHPPTRFFPPAREKKSTTVAGSVNMIGNWPSQLECNGTGKVV